MARETSEKVRLSDIAEKLGISTVTVSKALANKDGVGPELKLKIRKLADEMGYTGKALFPKRMESDSGTGNIGVLIPNRFFSPSTSFYWHIFNYLSTELLRRNYYSIMELLSSEDEADLVYPRLLQDRKVDALIVLGQVSEAYLEKISPVCPNLLLLDFYTDNLSFDCVLGDNFYCSYLLTSRIIQMGHTDLRFVGNFDATSSIKDRFMGFARALMEHDLPVQKSEIINDRDDDGTLIDITLPEKLPSVFVCNCDATAVNLMELLESKGIHVPQDVSVTGFDDYFGQKAPLVPLTTVRIDPVAVANTASELIISKIKGTPYIKGRHLVGGEIILRDSTCEL